MKFKQQIQRFLKSPQALISASLAITGASQVLLLLLPSSELSKSEMANLAIWQTLVIGIGIFLSSIVSALIFSIMVTGADGSRKEASEIATLLPNIIKLASIILLIVAVVSQFIFKEHKAFFTLILLVSLGLALIASIQRSFYAGAGNWKAVSSQFAIDGVTRLMFLWMSLIFFAGSIDALLISSVSAQLISIFIPSILFPWWIGLSPTDEGMLGLLRKLTPLLMTTSGTLALTTFAPVVLRFGQMPVQEVSLLVVILLLARIPTTLLTPLALPQIRQVCQLYYQKEFRSEIHLYSKTLRWLLAGGLISAASIWTLVENITFASVIFDGFKHLNLSLVVLIVLVSTLFVIEGFSSSCIIGQGRFFEAGIIYLVATAIWIPTLIFFQKDSGTALVSIALGCIIVITGINLRIRRTDITKAHELNVT